jgi:hypothetical protein
VISACAPASSSPAWRASAARMSENSLIWPSVTPAMKAVRRP